MQAAASWDTEIGTIDISGATDDGEKTIFYTALYHTMICPNLFSDVDYKYRGMDGKLHEGKSPHYATFSLGIPIGLYIRFILYCIRILTPT